MLEMILVGTLTGAVAVLVACAIENAGERLRPFERRELHSAGVVKAAMEPAWKQIHDEQAIEEKKAA